MLRIKKSEMKLVSQGYHFDENGKKFVRVFTSLCFVKIQIKIQAHKEMHIKAISADFPYVINDNWVEMEFPQVPYIKDYIDERCKEVWFV